MAKISDLLSPADLRHIANLQVLARLVVEGFCSGLHRSPHKGYSVEFREHRAYVPGDELRRLDWRVFGRSDRFYIREYEEETNLRATLLVDASGSMAYGGDDPARGLSKFHHAARLAACLATLMSRQQDAVGLVLFDTAIREHVPPRSTPGHLRILLDRLQSARPGGETSLGDVLHSLAPRLHRRGLIILVSDLLDDPARLLPALAQLRHSRHEMVVMQVLHPDEIEFPFRDRIRFDSLEDPATRLTVDAALVRDAYLDALARHRQALATGCRRHRIDLVSFSTLQPYAEALAAYLSRRARQP